MLLVLFPLLLHVVLNILLSVEIHNWIPATREKLVYYALLWLLPVVGIILVWRRVRPDWFRHEPGNGKTLSSGLLAVDAIFNPGSAHVLEAQKRGEITIRMEGEMVDRELPENIEIVDNARIDQKPENGNKD
jgi:hypothetical protein